MTATLWIDTEREQTIELCGALQLYAAFAQMAKAAGENYLRDWPNLFGVVSQVESQDDAPADWLIAARKEAIAFAKRYAQKLPPLSVEVLRKLARGPEGDLHEEIKHVFGRCVDTSTHKVVPCPSSGTNDNKVEPSEQKEEKLASAVKEMEATEAGRATLSRGAKIAAKVKGAIGTATASAMQALDEESKGGGSYLLAALKKKDIGGINQGLNAVVGSIFTNVYEEVFEYALAGHSFSGAHAVGVIAAKGAAVAETKLLQAVAWAWKKATTRESVDWLTEAAEEWTDSDKRFASALAHIGAEAIRAVLQSAGAEADKIEIDQAALGKKIVAPLVKAG